MTLYNELIELSLQVEERCKIKVISNIDQTIELSDDITIPYVFTCEALHPGTFRGYDIEENEIVMAQNTIFETEGEFHNYEINKDHKSSRKPDSSVDDVVGKVIDAKYDYIKKAYILTGEIYDKAIALRLVNKLIKYVSLRINPGRIDYDNGRQIARNLKFEELSFVRAPGDSKAKIY